MNKKRILNLPLAALAILAGTTALSSCGKEKSIAYNLNFDCDISGTSITMWTSFGGEMQAFLEGIVPEFEEATGVTVNFETKSGYDNLKAAIVGSASTKSYPNITFGYPDHFASYVASDIIVRLDYYFENGASTKYDYAPAGDQFKIDDFYADYMVENQTIEYDENGKGYTLGVPFNKSTETMTYNVTFFNWAKTQDSTIAVPATWDEVATQSEKILDLLEEKGVYGHVVGNDNKVYADSDACYAATGAGAMLDFSLVQDASLPGSDPASSFRPLGRDSQSNFFITSIRQWGGTYTTIDSEGRGHLAFDSQETKDALTEMQNLYNNNYIGIPATWGEAKYCSNVFTRLNCVMTIGSSAGVDSNAPTGDKFDILCAPVPYKSADKKYVISQGTNLCLLDVGTEAQRVASWELMKFLSKYKNGQFAALSGYFPASQFAYESEDYQDFLNSRAVSTADKINLSAAQVNDIYLDSTKGWVKFLDQPFNGSSTVRTNCESAMPRLLIDGLTPAQVIAEQYEKSKDYR